MRFFWPGLFPWKGVEPLWKHVYFVTTLGHSRRRRRLSVGSLFSHAHPQQKQLQLYADLMEEMKVRFDCINHAARGRSGLPAPIVQEFLYQQLRFLCELIAISCLVAHGDIAALKSHKIGRSYSADEILRRMTALRPHFYPNAIRETSVTILPSGVRNDDHPLCVCHLCPSQSAGVRI